MQYALNDRNAEAMDLLIRLMQTNPAYKDGIAKTSLVELFEKLGTTIRMCAPIGGSFMR